MTSFTRAEAEALLPTVRSLLEDIQRRAASYARRPSDPLASELHSLIVELQALGVELKDPNLGLVDFRTLRRGREVYLCWKLGEGDRIAWWHEIEAGYPGRKIIED